MLSPVAVVRPSVLLKAVQPARPPVAALQALARLGRRHRFERGRAVLRCGEPTRSLWLLERGRVSIGRHDAAGHWSPSRSVHEAEWIDAWSAWLGSPLLEGALAESECIVWEFTLAELEGVCAAHPAALQALIVPAAARVRRLVDERQGLLSQDVLARCARWLLEALALDGHGGQTVVLAQRKRSVAAELGATPETFSRTLRLLRERGVIDVAGYRIRVRDVDALQGFAAGRVRPG
jgi:CRP-like cAMP-binding protein